MRNWISKPRLWIGFFLLFWFTYFTYFWLNAFFVNERGGLSVTNVNLWGDWAAHFTMGSHLAYNNFIPETSPLAIGQPFSYPFATSWISAVLIKSGISFVMSFVLPSYIFCVLAVVALFVFYRKALRSWKTAILACTIFLLNGGLGFVYFIRDLSISKNPWLTLLNPPVEYTNIEDQYIRWISVIQSMFIPQRAFTLGFPWALLFLILMATLYQKGKLKLWQSLTAGVLLGLLPIVHTHSFLAVSIIAGCWFVALLPSFKKQPGSAKQWVAIGLLGLSIAVAIIKTFFLAQVDEGFVRWYPGWYAHQFPQLNWVWFWFLNWGVVPLIAVVELFFQVRDAAKKDRLRVLGFWAPFFILFMLLNLFLFQPFIWDNTKILVWASVGFSGLTALWFKRGWTLLNKKQPMIKSSIGKVSLGLILLFTILSGAIDTYRILRFPTHSYEMYSVEDVELANWAKNNTAKDSIWLTGDQHNHWLFNLTGRQSLLTYRGWLWTHGYAYLPIESDQYKMFSDPRQYQSLFEKYNITYIVIGPNEREVWTADEKELVGMFETVKQTTHFKVLQRQSAPMP